MASKEQNKLIKGLIRTDRNGNVKSFAEAFALPESDMIATSEGVAMPGFVNSSDDETKEVLLANLEYVHGIRHRELRPENSVRIHGFSAEKWNANWEPKGPKHSDWAVVKNSQVE